MNNTIIPAGYRLSITSWENDADHYKTVVKAGLDEHTVKFYLQVLSLFTSGSNDTTKFGNLNYHRSSSQGKIAAAQVAVREVAAIFKDTVDSDLLEYFSEDITSAMTELMGYSEDFIFRVFESALVEFIPQDIEITNVTDQFLKGK